MTRTEEIIRAALADSKDPFVEVAAEMYSIRPEGVTKMQRQLAKASAYQYLYNSLEGPRDLKEVFHRG